MLAGIAACGLLLFNTASRKGSTDYADLDAYRRLWGDLAIAITSYLDQRFPAAVVRAEPAVEMGLVLPSAADVYRRILLDRIAKEDVRPTQFWRTVKVQAFLRERGQVGRPLFEDPGRAWLLAAGFRALGGISPFLLLWLGALVCCPILLWTAWEFFDAGQSWSGIAFLAVLASSPFVVEVLAFPRSSAGFYVLASLLLAPLAVYGILGRPTVRGLLLRALAGGLLFALAALCRSGALFLLLGFFLALAVAARRALAMLTPSRWLLLFAATSGLFLAPYLAVRPTQHHDIWSAVWEGLGDFDRSKGYTWSDAAAEKVAQAAGASTLKTPQAEAVLRAMVLSDIRRDPLWFAGILARRLFATVTQQKLWPWAPLDGVSMAPSTSPNEGFMHKYFRYTYTVDFLCLGNRQWEIPISLLGLPTLVFAALAGVAWWRRSPADPRMGSGLLLLLTMALATLPLPVLISTAGGQETQTFALAYFLGFGLLAEYLMGRARKRRD